MPRTERAGVLTSSYRDPSGFLFRRKGRLLRQVNLSYRSDYDHCKTSGLYDDLIQRGHLIPHQESSESFQERMGGYKVIVPEEVPFISYPYEWCFSQLKDASLLTLNILRVALRYGAFLKDASPFNVQFHRGKPIFIDSLSFRLYQEGEPWVAYRQFCEQFLAPLALVAFCHERLALLPLPFLDGIPLGLTSRILPLRARFNLGIFTHIVLHARSQWRFQGTSPRVLKGRFTKTAFLGLIDSLERTVRSLEWNLPQSTWLHYDDTKMYAQSATSEKEQFVRDTLGQRTFNSVWDLGANLGLFSKIPASEGIHTLAFDSEHAVVERLYRKCRGEGEENILPTVADIAAPSPSVGWQLRERMSLIERGPADLVLALALIHHLAIGRNVPLHSIAEFLSDIGRNLVIEFVPKEDPQIRRMLLVREDVFARYSLEEFERVFGRRFVIQRRTSLTGTDRILYSMKNRRSS